ncbi:MULTISPECIES: rod shape-determining protein MreD [Streptomyces]|uniref:Rod shape-determining protein MreD n=2 Tax=Streptomyces rimosus subsp. rimosus TaxID=132474 RepID=L8EJ74_STRR1|nr:MULTISPECIES: rod shape-determining protein MreD [Streptomyces]KOG71944.1 rod shape-determining protein MreD [Kitasatospora aureofaciens]MYT41287.1 rod shape-determining protein MreD [Streptomyces sp. SID5471]KEF06037.1 rod shape-determining protein MreD [Streptomyces rimosus]KEF19035.1 rod shape-determining protein MreD [Streptomyces rimosus]KOT26753.1 rod shape-determining protein MreD [Streptomyces sp. NRRL WC-3701]
MRIKRILLSAALVVVALLVQVAVLARLQLPGAVPDLLLLVVLGLALVYGHVSGALIGFGAGLLADLAPPSDHAIGRYALVLCVIGYVAGLTKPDSGQHRSATMPLVVVIGAALGSTLLYAGVGSLVGDSAAARVGLGWLLFTATLYDLLLAPFAVPVVMALARRTEHDPLATDGAGGPGGSGKGRKSAYGWLGSGTGLKASRSMRTSLPSKPARIGGQRGGLLGRSARGKTGRMKGVKRL